MKKILLLSILALGFTKTFSMNSVVDPAQGDIPPSQNGDIPPADAALAVDLVNQELEDRLELAKSELEKTTLSPEQQQQALKLLRKCGETQGHGAITAKMVTTITTGLILEARLAKEKAGQLQIPSAPAMAAVIQPDVISQSDGNTLQNVAAVLKSLKEKIEAASTIDSKVAQLRARLRDKAQNKKGPEKNRLSKNEALSIIDQFIDEEKKLELSSQAASASDNADDNAGASNQPEQSQEQVQKPVAHPQPDAENQQEAEITVDTELPLATIQKQLEKYISSTSSSIEETQLIHTKLKELTEASASQKISKRTAIQAVINVRKIYKLQAEVEQQEREGKNYQDEDDSQDEGDAPYSFDPNDSLDQQRPPLGQTDPESLVEESPNPYAQGSAQFYAHEIVKDATLAGRYISDQKRSALLMELLTESDRHPEGIIPVNTVEKIAQRILGAPPQQHDQVDSEDEEKGDAERKPPVRPSREDDELKQAQRLSLAEHRKKQKELQDAEELALMLAQIESFELSQQMQEGLDDKSNEKSDDEERKIQQSEQQASNEPKKKKPSALSASPEQLELDIDPQPAPRPKPQKTAVTHTRSGNQQPAPQTQPSELVNQKQTSPKPTSRGKKQSAQSQSQPADTARSTQQQVESDNKAAIIDQSQQQPTGGKPVEQQSTTKQEHREQILPRHQSSLDFTGEQPAELESAPLKTVSSEQSKKTEQQPVQQKTIRTSGRTISPKIIATVSAAMTIGIFAAYKYKAILHNRILNPVINFYNSLRKKQLKQTEVNRKKQQ